MLTYLSFFSWLWTMYVFQNLGSKRKLQLNQLQVYCMYLFYDWVQWRKFSLSVDQNQFWFFMLVDYALAQPCFQASNKKKNNVTSIALWSFLKKLSDWTFLEKITDMYQTQRPLTFFQSHSFVVQTMPTAFLHIFQHFLYLDWIFVTFLKSVFGCC